MPYIPILPETIQAAGDITAKRFVGFDNKQCDAAGEMAKGVAHFGASTGSACTIITLGVAEVETGGAVNAGDLITTDDQGRAITASMDQHVNGIARTSASGAGEIIEIFVTCGHKNLNDLVSKLASTGNGEGASMIGVEDAQGLFDATNVEGALAESHLKGRVKILTVPLEDCQANSTVRTMVLAVGSEATVDSIHVCFHTPPSSDAGTVTLDVKRWKAEADQEVSLLSAAFDLETLTAKESAELTLTETEADLQLAEGDSIYVEVTSDNADMTGGTDGCITIVLVV